jgi:capsular exopolysaccharide synthesis family protein
MKKNIYTTSVSSKNDKINLREIFEKYYYHWKWLLFSFIISIASAFLYLKYTTYQYEVSSIILINDGDSSGGSYSELSVFQDLGLLGVPKTTLDTEMGVLKSRSLMEKVIKELDLQITYYIKKGFTTKEIYKDEVPFKLNLTLDDSISKPLDTLFSIKAKSKTQYTLSDSKGNLISNGIFGESISCKFGNLTTTPKVINNVKIGQEIFVKISPLEDVAINYIDRLKIVPENIKSNLLIISLQDPVRLKAQTILDNLVRSYNKNAIEYKTQIAKSTDEFIKNRIDDISVELTNLDQGVETYKIDNRFSNTDSETGIVLASNAEIGNQIVELTSQIKLIDYVSDYMNSNKNDLIPANLGVVNEITSQNMVNYNKLLLERNRLSGGANNMNPIIINLNDQISRLRESIVQSLINYKSSLEISLNATKTQEGRLTSKISAAPKKEREIRDIQRQQQTIETLYLYLLQKREENSISLAATAPIAKIIDTAYGRKTPVSPRKMIVLIVASLLGLLIPVFIILVRSILDNKVHNAEDVEDLVKAPILGDIPHAKSKNKLVVSERVRSNVAESFRLLRTNINFMLSATDKGAKVIFVTSTLRGEGKTFISINLASTFALLNKRVLLIGSDIRMPKIATYLNIKQEKGLSHFLMDRDLQLEDIIMHHEKSNIDILDTGIIPPNPSELLINGRFDEVIAYGKQHYDYVIIDTSPVNVVTDTLLLRHHADLFVYVIRANYLDKRQLKIPKKLYKNKRLPNMTLILNDTNVKKGGNEYGYGETGAD